MSDIPTTIIVPHQSANRATYIALPLPLVLSHFAICFCVQGFPTNTRLSLSYIVVFICFGEVTTAASSPRQRGFDFSRGLKPIDTYTSSGFPESHHRQVVDGSIPTYRTHKNTPESHHRQVVDGSIPTCELNNGKQGLGLNHPPPAGGGIPGSFPVLVGWD